MSPLRGGFLDSSSLFHRKLVDRLWHSFGPQINAANGEWRPKTLSTIYTIGHSTRTLDELAAALKGHNIATLVDIRAFPMSRRLPHFNRESLETELPKQGIAYIWMKETWRSSQENSWRLAEHWPAQRCLPQLC